MSVLDFKDLEPPLLKTPNFLRFSGAGINISDHSVKLMDLKPQGDQLIPKQFASMSIPEGAVSSGSIEDRSAVARVLKKLRNRFGVSHVRLSIPEENGYIFNIKMPPLKESELREALSLRLPEQVPLPPDKVVFDFDITHQKENGARFVTVSVLPQEIVVEYMHICNEAGLRPLSFEIEAQTISRAVISPNNSASVMVVDIGKSRTGLFIVDSQTVKYTSTLQMGGDRLTEAVKKSMDISLEEAEELKQEEGFVKNAHTRERYTALTNAVSVFVDEINRRFGFWHTHSDEIGHKGNDIDKIILVGGNASVPGLADHIAESLDVPVEIGDVWTNAFDINEFVPELDFRHSLTYTSAIGLALSREL